jgi:hypothetical protein
MKKILLSTLAGIIGLPLGWIIGATIAGNYFTSFTLFGVRGYEASGILGGLILAGILFGAVWQLFGKRDD